MSSQETSIQHYDFPEAESIIVSGDIHGDYNLLVNKLCVQYSMTNTLLIVAGDCGFGFNKSEYYEQIVRKNNKRMRKANNWIVFVRGNHDAPQYFNGETFKKERFIAVPDYSVLTVCGHSILCVGGAVSIDRGYRKEAMRTKNKAYYWPDEMPVFDAEKLKAVGSRFAIDTVITHTAPSFCELFQKDIPEEFLIGDDTLLADMKHERQVMDDLCEALIAQGHPLSHWFYGHFHQSRNVSIDGILFAMLDIMEFRQLY